MPDGGGQFTLRALVSSAVARTDGAFVVDDIAPRVPWLKRRTVTVTLCGLVRSGMIRRIGHRVSPKHRLVAVFVANRMLSLPQIATAAGACAPDVARADQSWRARIGAGARFDVPITATEARQLREISQWQND